MKQRKLISLFLAIVMAFAVMVPNALAAEPQNTENISVLAAAEPLPATLNVSYLTLAPGSDATQLTFSWHTSARADNPSVRIWRDGGEAVEFTGTSSSSTSSISAMYYNGVTVTALEADTVYTYQVSDGTGNWSAAYTTKTGNPDAFSYIIVGDPQIGSSNVTADTNAWVNAMNLMAHNFPNAAFLAGTGDQIETSGTLSHYTGFFSPTQMTSLPFASVMGNHEGSGEATRTFYNPPNADSVQNHWYRYGDTLFLVWNCTTGSPSGMRTFINNSISANPDAKWIILSFHYDVYGQGSSHALSDGKTYRDQYVTVIDEFDIDVVFNGHDHSYNRTYPMKWSGSSGTSSTAGRQLETFGSNGESINPTGTVYFSLNSSTGSKYYSLITQQYYTAKQQQANRPHFSVVDMTANSFTCTTYQIEANNSLTLIDTYTIVKTNVEIVTYTVTFDTYGGNDIAPATVIDGTPAAKPADPTKEGYAFIGWTINGEAYDFNAPVTGGITLTAVWEAKSTFETVNRVSNFESNWYYYGRTNSALFADAFDMDALTSWTLAKAMIGFPTGGNNSGIRINTLIDTGSGAHQRGNPLHTWTYFKNTFELPANFDADTIIDASGIHLIDDALVIFINGVEVYRYNTGTSVSMDTAVNWGNYAGRNTDEYLRNFTINSDYNNRDTGYASTDSGSPTTRDAASLTNLKNALKPGTNVITCVVGQRDSASSDLFFDLQMSITTEVSTIVADANYSAVEEAIAAAGAMDSSLYTNFDDVTAAIEAVVYGLGVTEQDVVDGFASAINDAVASLVLKPVVVTVASASDAKFVSIIETLKNSNVWTLTFNVKIAYSDGSSKAVQYTVNLNGNNANLDGKYRFEDGHDLAGYTLVYDIKGNGSNIKDFRLTK